MSLVSRAKKKLTRLIIHKSNRFLLSRTISVKSLPMPTIKEVALTADLRCTKCQERVANVISKVNDWESIVVHVSEKKVTLTRKSVSKVPSKCPVYNRVAQLSSQC